MPADWLALRRPADEEAREPTHTLLARLWRHLHAAPNARPGEPVHVVDLGAGTGANQAWLAPRLPFPARWTLVDHDASLLDAPGHGPGRRVLADLDALPRLLHADGAWAQVVTCAALLDLLTPAALTGVVDAALDVGAPALFALTVTGVVEVDPPDADDATLGAAFDAHQRRDGRAGPDAPGRLHAAASRRGAEIVTVHTPWRLDSRYSDLLERYVRDRADVAVEQDPGLRDRARAWRDRRLADAAERRLTVRVGHEDVLVLPGAPGADAP